MRVEGIDVLNTVLPNQASSVSERIRFARDSRRRIKRFHVPQLMPFMHLFAVAGLLSMTPPMERFLPYLGWARAMGGWYFVPVGVVQTGLIIGLPWVALWLFVRRAGLWRRRLDESKEELAIQPSPTARLWCIGTPAALQLEEGSLGAAFEPYMLGPMAINRIAEYPDRPRDSSSHADRDKGLRACLIIFAFVLGVAAAHFLFTRVMTGAPGTSFTSFVGPPGEAWYVAKLGVGFAFAVVVHHWTWRVYLRVLPGRLEVLQFSLFRQDPVLFSSYSLHDARILVDLRRQLMFIDLDDRSIEIFAILMRHRVNLARALFSGAVSQHVAPSTSRTELL